MITNYYNTRTSAELVFATGNAHKLEEAAAILGAGVTLSKPQDYGLCEDVEETADTLEGNALLKARWLYGKLHRNCFADDTGLEVECLGGAPGVRSARYAGECRDMAANRRKLLAALQDAPVRRARFRTVIALLYEGEEELFEGIVEGSIAMEEQGGGGFGYDSIFIPSGMTLTFAQLPPDIKNAISHRARALELLKDFLEYREIWRA